MTNKHKSKHKFENNPFFIASNGITTLVEKAQGVFILFVVVAIVELFSNDSPDASKDSYSEMVSTLQSWTSQEWTLFLGSGFFIALAAIMIYALFSGVSSYTSAQLARGFHVNIRDAFRVSFENLWAYLWLQIIIFVKIFLWSLLFIIPGIIMAVRYSLAGVAFFDEKKHLRGDAAVKESIRMTKNAWITTYAAGALFNILTLGTVSRIVGTSVNAVLYDQFEKTGDKKPDAHWLSWATLIIPFVAIAFVLLLVGIGGILLGVINLPF